MADQYYDDIPAVGNEISADIPKIESTLGFLKDALENFVNAWSNTDATGIYVKTMADADADTGIQVEESADEDIIRFDTAGTERVNITAAGIVNATYQSTARAYQTSAQTITTGTLTKITLDTENWDVQGEFDSTTNSRFTATEPGYYQINAGVGINNLDDGKFFSCSIYKNGITHAESRAASPAANIDLRTTVSDVVYMDGSTDYVEIWVSHDNGTSLTLLATTHSTFMSVHKLS